MDTIGSQLSVAFRGLIDSIVAGAPRVVVGLVLLLAAILVAKIVERGLRAALRRLKLDRALERLGADRTLNRVGVSRPLSEVVARIAYFLLLLLFVRTAADGLGLTALSSAIGSFLSYIPYLVSAATILILGSVGAQAAGKAVGRAAESSGIEFATSLGTLATAALMLVIAIMAIGQLRIDTDIVRVVVMGALGAFALAFGLSFGLGSREITRNILAGYYARKTFTMGETLEVGDARGRLSAITPTQTLLEDGEQVVAVANSVFLEKVVRQ
ncbi:MAG: mechanosensitive ion channel [Gemmatimonadetes bacterium]|nr:mechanosensitive ion channel [Gemmatimonadota bacterium]